MSTYRGSRAVFSSVSLPWIQSLFIYLSILTAVAFVALAVWGIMARGSYAMPEPPPLAEQARQSSERKYPTSTTNLPVEITTSWVERPALARFIKRDVINAGGYVLDDGDQRKWHYRIAVPTSYLDRLQRMETVDSRTDARGWSRWAAENPPTYNQNAELELLVTIDHWVWDRQWLRNAIIALLLGTGLSVFVAGFIQQASNWR